VQTGAEPEPEREKRHYQRALFDGIADRYEAARPGYPPRVVEFVAATAGLGPGAPVLEVGCGTGQLTERPARSGFRLTAIDIGPSLIAAARRRVTEDLRRLLEPQPTVHLTRRTSVTMAEVLDDR
jgi:2-polyprenyl-3-methyl-5-hydroxy-6-metoxy-1,4-benzoquinol methylase